MKPEQPPMPPIDPVDVLRNPQDYLLRGERITNAVVCVESANNYAHANDGRFRGEVTRRPKTRKVKARAFYDHSGHLKVETEDWVTYGSPPRHDLGAGPAPYSRSR